VPPRPTFPDHYRCVLSYKSSDEIGGHVAANVLYLECEAASPTASDLTTLAGNIRTAWTSAVAAKFDTHWSLQQVEITALDGTENQGVDSTIVPGTGGTNPLPPQVAACISWHIPAAYRGGHPRSYQPGIDQGYLTSTGSNEMSPTAAINLAVAWDNFITAVDALTMLGDAVVLGTVSYIRNKAPRVTPVFYGYVEGLTRVNTRLASQRRRSGKLSVGSYEV
jgi:hypothetical protein